MTDAGVGHASGAEAARRHELADFLRRRREGVAPEQVGLAGEGRRRTPGLRREEVAALANVSTTYYTWLEQARNVNPSAQVLASIAAALQLDGSETAHLFELACLPAPAASRLSSAPAVGPMLQHVLDNQGSACALLQDDRWNVVAWNEAACRVLFDFPSIPVERRNYLWLVFADEDYRERLHDWERQARALVARFRAEADSYADDPWLREFVEGLSVVSPEFARWWPLHEVAGERSRIKVLSGPVGRAGAGELVFEHTVFTVADQPGLRLFLNVPVPGTDTEERMRSLL